MILESAAGWEKILINVSREAYFAFVFNYDILSIIIGSNYFKTLLIITGWISYPQTGGAKAVYIIFNPKRYICINLS